MNEVRELFELRGSLEGRAAGLTADRIGEQAVCDAVERLQSRSANLSHPPEFRPYWEFNEELHTGILAHSGNKLLIRMAEQTRTLTSYYFFHAATYGNPEGFVSIDRSCDQHDEILRLIRAGCSLEAEFAMRSHIHDNGVSMLNYMQESGNFDLAVGTSA